MVHGKNAKMTKALAYICKNTLSKAWNSWQQKANTKTMQRAHRQKASYFFTKHTMVVAWNTWRTNLGQRALERHSMRQAANFFLNKQACVVWNAWNDFVIKRSMKLQMLQKATDFHQPKVLSRALHTWAKNMQEDVLEREYDLRSLTFMQHQVSIIKLLISLRSCAWHIW